MVMTMCQYSFHYGMHVQLNYEVYLTFDLYIAKCYVEVTRYITTRRFLSYLARTLIALLLVPSP